MTERERPDPEEQAFGASLEPGIRELRSERGPCPPEEELLALVKHQLASDDAMRIQDHVEACGLCDLALTRLRPGHTDSVPQDTSIWAKAKTLLWNPVLAYGLAALLAYPAYKGVQHLRAAEALSTDGAINSTSRTPTRSFAESLQVVELSQTRGTANHIRVNNSEDGFILKFFAPMTPAITYSAAIRNKVSGNTLDIPVLASPDSLGNVLLVCTKNALPSGDYTLTVRQAGSEHVLLQYAFELD